MYRRRTDTHTAPVGAMPMAWMRRDAWPRTGVTATSPQRKEVKIPFGTKLVTGAIAGIIGTCCVFPIDIVKTRLQNQVIVDGQRMYRNPIHCFTTILRTEGFRGLYRGLGANLIGVTPEKAIKLAVNDFMRETLTTDDGELSLPRQIAAGATAGFVQVIATNPMELVKIQMQMAVLQGETASTFTVVKRLGLRGLYRGTSATLLRDVPYSVVMFPGYAFLKEKFADENGKTSLPAIIAAGGIAGAVAGGSATPQDVVKTRLQTKGLQDKYTGVVDCFTKIIKEEGVGALFKGVANRAMVQFPLFGIALVAFEIQKDAIRKKMGEA